MTTNQPPAANPRDLIEQAARHGYCETSGPPLHEQPSSVVEPLEAQTSIPISLKRIADALEQQANIAATTAAYAPATHDLRGEFDA